MWFRQPQAQAPFFWAAFEKKKSLPGGGGGRVESAAARAPTSRFRLPQGASAVRMAPANPEFVTESDGTPKAKPSKELIDAMKRCISASVKEDEVQLSSKAAGIEVRESGPALVCRCVRERHPLGSDFRRHMLHACATPGAAQVC